MKILKNSTILGTNDSAMRQVKFSLDNVPGYHLEYRVHSADIGWQDWIVEGNYAGNPSKIFKQLILISSR